MNSEFDVFLKNLSLSRKCEIIRELLLQVRHETNKKPTIPLSKEEDDFVAEINIIEKQLNPVIESDYIRNFNIESKIRNIAKYNEFDQIENYKLVSLFLKRLKISSKPAKLDKNGRDITYVINYLKSCNFKNFISVIEHCSEIMYEKKLEDYENGNYKEEQYEDNNDYTFENSSCPLCQESPCMCSDPQHNW